MKTATSKNPDDDGKIVCPNCAELINAAAILCRFCNSGISTEYFSKCNACSELIRKDAKVCRYCKAENENADNAQASSYAGSSKHPNKVYSFSKEDLARLDSFDGKEPEKSNDKVEDAESKPFKANMSLIREREKVILALLQKNFANIEEITEELQNKVRAEIRELVNKDEAPLTMMEKGVLLQNILDEVFGFGPLGPLLRDPTVGDIFVNAYDQVFVERHGEIIKTGVTFENKAHLRQTIDKITIPMGLRFDESNPIVDARLPNGSRVNATMSADGPTLTITCFSWVLRNLSDWVEREQMSMPMAKLLKACVQGRVNIAICGPGGSGKSSLLNTLIKFVGEKERIISIQRKAELRIQQENWVKLETKIGNTDGSDGPSYRKLVQAALLMRPDRLVVAEIRGEESFDFLDAMHAGLYGSLCTLNANSAKDCVERLKTMLLMSGQNLDSETAQRLIANSIQLIVFIAKLSDGSRRIAEICEIRGLENSEVKLNTLFKLEKVVSSGATTFSFQTPQTALPPNFIQQINGEGIEFGPGDF